MQVKTTQHGAIDILQLPQQLVLANATATRRELLQHVEGGRHRLILDMGSASFVDSSGLSVLVSVLKAVRKVDGQVVLLNLSDNLRALIELTRMHEVFEIFADRDAALTHLNAGQVA